VSCCLTSCTNNYHFMCARQKQCAFLEDKKVYCQHHRDLIKGEVRNHACNSKLVMFLYICCEVLNLL